LASSRLAVVAIDFDYLNACPGEEPGQSCPIGSGSLDAHLPDLPEPGEPREQSGVAVGGGVERFRPEESAHLVQCGSHVNLAVGVDAASDASRSFYDGHWPSLPFL